MVLGGFVCVRDRERLGVWLDFGGLGVFVAVLVVASREMALEQKGERRVDGQT